MVFLLVGGREREITGPDELLELLAELDAMENGQESLQAGCLESQVDPASFARLVARVGDWIEDTTLQPAEEDGREALLAWLETVERLERALRFTKGLDAAAFPWAVSLAGQLAPALECCGQALEREQAAHWWRCGRVAEERRAAQEGSLPWCAAVWPTRSEVFDQQGPDHRSVLAAWQRGELDRAAEAELSRRVQLPGCWRDAYRELLRGQAASAHLVFRDTAFAHAAELTLPLPHLGRDAALQVWSDPDGSRWLGPGGYETRLTRQVLAHVWDGDEVTGPLATALHEDVQVSDQQVREAIYALRKEQRSSPGAGAVVQASLCVLQDGGLVQALVAGAEAFRNGSDAHDELLAQVAHAVELRAQLQRVAGQLLSEPLARLDQQLAACQDATLLLDASSYTDLVSGVELPEAAWWAYPRRLDEAVPDGGLDLFLMPVPEPAGGWLHELLAAAMRPPRLVAAGAATAAGAGLLALAELASAIRQAGPDPCQVLATIVPCAPPRFAAAVLHAGRRPDPTLAAHTVLWDDGTFCVRVAELLRTLDGRPHSELALSVELTPEGVDDSRVLGQVEVLGPGDEPLAGWTRRVGPEDHPRLHVRVFPAQPGGYCIRHVDPRLELRFEIGAAQQEGPALVVGPGAAPAGTMRELLLALEREWHTTRYRAAVLRLLRAFEANRRAAPRFWELLRYLLDHGTGSTAWWGVLARDPAHWEQLEQLHRWATGVAPPSWLERLRLVPPAFPGEVHLPGVIAGEIDEEAIGIVRTLCAEDGAPAGPEARDPQFRAALQQARHLAALIRPDVDPARLESIGFTFRPSLPPGASADGSSVGLAALVAIISLLEDRPVPREFVFSGELRGEALVRADLFPEKFEALADLPYLSTLFFPDPPREDIERRGFRPAAGGFLLDGILIQTQCRIEQVLDLVFPCTPGERPRGWLRGIPAWPAARLRPPAGVPPAEGRWVLSLLAAAAGPLSRAELEQVSLRPDQQGIRRERPLLVVLDELERICPGALLLELDARSIDLAPAARQYWTVQLDTAQLRAAHTELANGLEQRHGRVAGPWLSRIVVHQDAAGDGPARDRALGELACWSPAEAWRVARQLDSEQLATASRALAAASDVAPRLLRLALLAEKLPLPAAVLAERLVDAPDGTARLMVLQGLVESLLHLLACAALALRRGRVAASGADRTWLEFGERPSVGRMVDALQAGFARTQPDEAGGAFAAALYRLLAAPTLRVLLLGQEGQPRVPPLASRLNDALHHLGAWQELLDPQQAERTFADLLEPVTCLVEQLGPLLVDHPLVFLPEGEEGALVLRLPGPACPLPGRYALRTSTPGATNPTYLPLAGLLVRLDPDRPGQIGLYRGIIGHRLRWWGYDGTRSATAPLPRAAARLAGDFGDLAGGAAALHPDLLVWAGQARLEPQPQAGPRPALPSADRLPLPLARTVIALRQARSAAERLAAVDTSFAVLLRLAAFLSVSTEHRDGWMGFLWPKVVHPRRPTWLARATKRNLLDLILTRGHAPCGLRDLLAGPAATELVNLLERIEHLPAAAAEVEEEVDSAAQWLSGLLEASPWGSAANDRPVLWGLARGQCWRLMGSAPGLDDQPAAAVAGLPDGSLYVQAGGEIYPLGPFATLASATGEEGSLDVWLLDEEKDGRLPPEKASLWLFALGFRGLAGDRTRQGRQQGRWVEEGVGVRLALGAS